jgi:hypothetical protein
MVLWSRSLFSLRLWVFFAWLLGINPGCKWYRLNLTIKLIGVCPSNPKLCYHVAILPWTYIYIS